jgi:hypothetical protein
MLTNRQTMIRGEGFRGDCGKTDTPFLTFEGLL